MQQILDAILAGDTDHARSSPHLDVPESYRAATVHKDEVDMFEGMDEHATRTRASRCTSRRWRCPSSARARRWSR